MLSPVVAVALLGSAMIPVLTPAAAASPAAAVTVAAPAAKSVIPAATANPAWGTPDERIPALPGIP